MNIFGVTRTMTIKERVHRIVKSLFGIDRMEDALWFARGIDIAIMGEFPTRMHNSLRTYIDLDPYNPSTGQGHKYCSSEVPSVDIARMMCRANPASYVMLIAYFNGMIDSDKLVNYHLRSTTMDTEEMLARSRNLYPKQLIGSRAVNCNREFGWLLGSRPKHIVKSVDYTNFDKYSVTIELLENGRQITVLI